MCTLRYQVVVCKRHPVSFAQLAFRGARRRPYRRRKCDGGAVCCEDRGQKEVRIMRVAVGWEESVGFEAVDSVGWDGGE